PTNEETSNLEETNHDDEQEISEIFRIETNLFDHETPLCEKFKEFNYLLKIDPDLFTKDIEGFKTYDEYKDDWIYEWNENVPWVHEKPWTDTRVWTEPTPVMHYCKPFNYKSGYSEWPTCSWKEDGYCNVGNLPGAYIRGWDGYEISDHDQEEREYEYEHEDEEKCELFNDHELSVCNTRRFEMIKYSFGDDEEYVAVKDDKYDDLNSTSKDDLTERKEIDNVGGESTNGNLEVLES
ncbi:hypothetical protein Tco_0713144, partial [Tanacetum coccineum]